MLKCILYKYYTLQHLLMINFRKVTPSSTKYFTFIKHIVLFNNCSKAIFGSEEGLWQHPRTGTRSVTTRPLATVLTY